MVLILTRGKLGLNWRVAFRGKKGGRIELHGFDFVVFHFSLFLIDIKVKKRRFLGEVKGRKAQTEVNDENAKRRPRGERW